MNDKRKDLPNILRLNLRKYKPLRYGENPHQQSAFYVGGRNAGFEQLWGIELSHNNVGDANQAWQLVCEFSKPTVAIIKHGNPSGICSRSDVSSAFKLAYLSDTISAFGGIVATNSPPTMEMVSKMGKKFFELLIAPSIPSDVLEQLKRRSTKMRVIAAKKSPQQLEFTRAFNGYLIQSSDRVKENPSRWKVVCGERPDKKTHQDLEFAWKVVKHVKSNAIVIVRDLNMLGMGTGQPNRVNAVKLALDQAKGSAKGAVLASDAFFPFEDSVELAAKAHVSTIVQPGGSINDERVIADAKKHGITMVFTGVRHFKH